MLNLASFECPNVAVYNEASVSLLVCGKTARDSYGALPRSPIATVGTE